MKVLLIFSLSFALGGCATAERRMQQVQELRISELVRVPLNEEHWQIVSTGEGRVHFTADGLRLEPKTPRFTKETYGAWVVAKEQVLNPIADYVVRLEVTTYRQLRKEPNDWEVFWFFGNYRAEPHLFKETNYFISKPQSGGELGRAFQAVGQEFLKTAAEPKLTLGKKTEFVYVKRGGTFKVYQDGALSFEFRESPDSKGLYPHPGTFGLYSEDALVTVHSFSYHAL